MTYTDASMPRWVRFEPTAKIIPQADPATLIQVNVALAASRACQSAD
jgi:hypothetical protein